MKYQLILLLFVVLTSCKNSTTEQQQAIQVQKEHTTSQPLSIENEKWANLVNTDLDGLNESYLAEAVKVNKAGEVINGQAATVQHYRVCNKTVVI